MKIRLLLVCIVASLFIPTASDAQILTPAKWKFSANVLNDKEAEIVAICTIEKGWHVYALTATNDKEAIIKPVATSLKVNASKDYDVAGGPTESKFINHYDPQFEMDLNYFENTATFKQKIKIRSDKKFKVSGELEFMACNEEVCVPPDILLFDVEVTPPGAAEGSIEETTMPDDASSAMGDLGIPLIWTYSSQNLGNNEYEIIAGVAIGEGYHIYSAVHETYEGPLPTVLKLDSVAGIQFLGAVTETPAVKKYDENFMNDVYVMEGNAEFRQRIRITDPNLKSVKGMIKGMVCADVCKQFGPFAFVIDLSTGVGKEFDPLAGTEARDVSGNDPFRLASVDLAAPINNCGQETTTQYSLWAIFLFGVIGGLLALLTPCVFPMIPLTVSFFTKGSEKGKGKQRAITYGFFIFLIYFLLSLPFHLSKNVDPGVLNSIATNVWLNIGFFVIFTVFAISFFGFYEITLPSGLANKVDNASNIGGGIGIFFMALTLAIVSFSCTGPILGTVIGSIYSTDVQGVFNLFGMELSMPAAKVSAAMMGFGIALGLPFALFAAFPGLLKKLPKSGGWMDDFKVSLGFLEVALAVKFLSNADLVQQWGIFKRETFFIIWILIGALWVLYMMGIFRFKAGQGSKGMSRFKLSFTIIIALFTLRLVPGVLPASSLNRFDFLSGFPPPKSYSYYHYEEEFKIYRDLDEALAVAAAEGKPVFLDFTGWACVNCRKMEDTVWPKEVVKEILSKEYVMCSLYVDEKVELPAQEQFVYETSDGRKKQIKTVGTKWATLQTETFQNNSQPMYALLSPNGHLLAPLEQSSDDPSEYADWLKCGLDGFEKWKTQASAEAR